jgi:WD40 repeat protein
VRLFDLSTGKGGKRLDTCFDVVRSGVFFHQGELFIVCATGIDRYDVAHGKRLAALAAHESAITAATLVGDKLAVGHHDGVLRIYDLAGGEPIEIPVPGPPVDVKSMALSPDGKILAVAWVQGSIWWWRTDQVGTFQRLVRHDNESDTVAFSGDGGLFAEEGKSHFTTIWSVGEQPRALGEVKNGAWVKRILFLRGASWIARGGSDGLELAEVRGPKRIVLDTAGKVEDISLDEHGSVLAAVDRMGRLTLWGP